jgi:hypothetical protein
MAVPVDLNTIHNPSVGSIPPATWGDHIRDTLEFLKSPPRVKVKRSSTQSISNGSETAVNWNAEDYDSELIHDNASNPSRLVCRTAGTYAIWATPEFTANGTGLRFSQIWINGVLNSQSALIVADGLTACGLPIYIETLLAVNDYVEIKVFQNSGGALTLTTRSLAGMHWFSS